MTLDDRHVRSSHLPGGDLVSAVLSREVMVLADRGGASNMVGDRWADLSAEFVDAWEGHRQSIPRSDHLLDVSAVVRLDATPEVARLASKRHLQNPDFLLSGRLKGQNVVQAADAKFSVETARSKQVSPEVTSSLLDLRHELPGVFDLIPEGADAVPGIFLSPDYTLTHVMLKRRHGIMRTTVSDDEVVLVPVEPGSFFAGQVGATIMPILEQVDALGISHPESLLVGLYYFRLARAVVGCWIDATKPLLFHGDPLLLDEHELEEETAFRAVAAESAFGLIQTWDLDVQVIRNQRHAVDQVAQLPMMNKELRGLVEQMASHAGVDPPSLNQVRRRATSWWRGELRNRVGPILPPVSDLPNELQRLAAEGKSLAPEVQPQVELIVQAMLKEQSSAGAPSPDA